MTRRSETSLQIAVVLVALLAVGYAVSTQTPSHTTASNPNKRTGKAVTRLPVTFDTRTAQIVSETQTGTSDPSLIPVSGTEAGALLWQPEVATGEWKYLVLHHSATQTGSVESIHAAHRQRRDRSGRPWLGIGYHFVIGNGRGMEDGRIEPTFRWNEQLPGAHAGDAQFNSHGIGICLIGNFQQTTPSDAQLTSLKRLIGQLKTHCDIAEDGIVRHGDIKTTACPGQLFPMEQIVRSLRTPRIASEAGLTGGN